MPAAAATKPRPNSLEAKRRAAAEELLGIHRKYADVFAREDELKAELKAIATELGTSFKEVFVGKGEVSASGNKDKQLLGEIPAVVDAKWLGLNAKQRKTLLAEGVIALAENWRGASYGRVTVKTF